MKTEATFDAGAHARSLGTRAEPQRQRWLADLERALLDGQPNDGVATQPSAGTAPAWPAARARPSLPAPTMLPGEAVVPAEATPPRTHGCPPDAKASRPVQAPSAASRDVASSDTMPQPVGTAARAVLATPAPPGANGTIGLAAADAAMRAAPAQASAPATAPALGCVTTPAGPGSTPAQPRLVLRASSEAPASGPDSPGIGQRSPAYAKRLLQVSGDDALQLTLRDAALPPAQQPSVALALFEQLQGAGLPLRRVYINGQRFDADASRGERVPFHPIPASDKE